MFNRNRLLLLSLTRGYRKVCSAEAHESERSLEAIVELVCGGHPSSAFPSTSSSSQASSKARPFLSAILTSTNIYTNLATEDELHRKLAFASVTDLANILETTPTNESEKGSTRSLPPSSEPFSLSSSHSDPLSLRCLSLLLSYINEPCVVIGRNQNPWQETNIRGIGDTHSAHCLNGSLCDSSSVPVVELARRSSGGGAVYHDLGNVCFSFMTHRTLYDPARSVEILRRYLLCRLAPFVRSEDITTTRRNDLFLFGHKITGSAMKVTSRGCYHHLTLLVASNRPSLGNYLTKHHRWEWVVSSAVDSVRSPVTTLAIALRGVPPEGKPSQSFAILSPELAKYPPLIPKDRFVGEDIGALLLTAEGKGSFMSPYERLLWLATIDAAFNTPVATSRAPTRDDLERIQNLGPEQQARLLQRDFCRFYEDCGSFLTPDALARMGSGLACGSVEGIVPYLYLSPEVVAPKQSTLKTAVSGSAATVQPASEARAKELSDRSRGLVPFASSEYSIKKTMLLEGFNGLYKTDNTCTDDKVVSRYSCITQRDIPLVDVNAESHFANVKRLVHLNKAEDHSKAPQRSTSQKLSDPRTLTEALEQQRSRVWLLKNTPKFTTLVRIPPFGRGNASGSTQVKSPRGWAEFLSSGEVSSSSSGTDAVGDKLNLPDIIIRTQVNGGGEIESIRCRFDHKAASGTDSIVPNRADVAEGESAANWFSEVMEAMLRGKFLRTAQSAVGEKMAPFPPRPAFARGLRAAENSEERQLFAIATERSLNINLLSTVDSSAFVALVRGVEAPLNSVGGPPPPVLRALAASAVSPQLHQSIAVGDIDEAVSLLLLSTSSSLANSEVSALLNDDTVVDHLVAGLVGCWLSELVDEWEDANAW